MRVLSELYMLPDTQQVWGRYWHSHSHQHPPHMLWPMVPLQPPAQNSSLASFIPVPPSSWHLGHTPFPPQWLGQDPHLLRCLALRSHSLQFLAPQAQGAHTSNMANAHLLPVSPFLSVVKFRLTFSRAVPGVSEFLNGSLTSDWRHLVFGIVSIITHLLSLCLSVWFGFFFASPFTYYPLCSEKAFSWIILMKHLPLRFHTLLQLVLKGDWN